MVKEKTSGDNIYKVLIFFDKLYHVMNKQEKRKLMEFLIREIQIYEERQSNGQWLKSITFKLPIIEEDMILNDDREAKDILIEIRESTGMNRKQFCDFAWDCICDTKGSV